MPALRSKPRTATTSPHFKKMKKGLVQTFVAKDDNVESMIDYPTTQMKREAYINPKSNRKLTPFYFQVYDLCAQVPKGQVTTYKHIADALQSGPRAVGQALRMNPFCPLPVPCHRVIASDLSIGGFSGSKGDSQFVADKKAKLTKEGCVFKEYNFVTNADGTRSLFTEFDLSKL